MDSVSVVLSRYGQRCTPAVVRFLPFIEADFLSIDRPQSFSTVSAKRRYSPQYKTAPEGAAVVDAFAAGQCL